MAAKKILLGLHSKSTFASYENLFAAYGYDVIQASSVDEMFQAMGLKEGSPPDSPPSVSIEAYLMDINLGSPDTPDYIPSLKIYQHLKAAVEAGEVKFLAFSLKDHAVSKAKEAGIPCFSKTAPIEQILDALGVEPIRKL